jgi:hypothetical protein
MDIIQSFLDRYQAALRPRFLQFIETGDLPCKSVEGFVEKISQFYENCGRFTIIVSIKVGQTFGMWKKNNNKIICILIYYVLM